MANNDSTLREEFLDYMPAEGEKVEVSQLPKVQDVDEDDRPYERAVKYGISTLSDADLLAIILRTGLPGRPITHICREIMKQFGGSFRKLSQASGDELSRFKGIGNVKVLQLQAVMEIVKRFNQERIDQAPLINSSKAVALLMMPIIGNQPVEHIYALCLSQSLRLIKATEISRGVATATVFDVKAVIKAALAVDAQCIMLCHNHPSGNMKPSPQDDNITRNMKKACEAMSIRMLDHIIVGGGTNTDPEYYSYNDNNRL